MTNPAPSAPGGIPKWLLVLVAVLLVIVLGCCGVFTVCSFLVRRGAQTAGSALDVAIKQAQAEAERQAEAARQRAMEQATQGVLPAPAPGEGDNTGPETGGNAPRPAAPTVTPGGGASTGTPAGGSAAPTPRAVRLPTNFPKDVPLQPGLTPTFQAADNTAGSGAVTFEGKVDRQTLLDYYAKQMKDNGWTEAHSVEMGEITQVQYTKDAREVVVQVSPGDNGHTNALISYGKN